VKIVTIAGVQGSGKTTLIRTLIPLLGAQGKQSAVIVNEEGEETYSPEFLETYGVGIFKLRGG
jgi:molybdopterin-guanine dinucleotide biosynthesis protein